MPTYDYDCSGCGQAFEVFQRMSDEPVSSCPDCGAPARRRISGGSGFIFKGEGFYITDHRSQEYRDKAAADEGREPAAASGAKASGSGSGDAAKKSEGKARAEAVEPAGGTSGAGAAGSGSGGDGRGSRSAAGAGSGTKAGPER